MEAFDIILSCVSSPSPVQYAGSGGSLPDVVDPGGSLACSFTRLRLPLMLRLDRGFVFSSVNILRVPAASAVLPRYLYSCYPDICILATQIFVFLLPRYLYSCYPDICILATQIFVFLLPRYLYSCYPDICILATQIFDFLSASNVLSPYSSQLNFLKRTGPRPRRLY